MKYNILLVEDDKQIREVIVDYFTGKSNGDIVVDVASDGEEGLCGVYEKEYDLILLDVMMHGMDGFSLCREIRKNSITPIIFITAKTREEDVLYGYNLGCAGSQIKTVISIGYKLTEE